MPRNFYFGKDASIVAGSATFAAVLAENPTSFGCTAAQSTAFSALDVLLQNAYASAIDPSTRTPVAIEAKNIALHNMRVSAINLARIIYSTPTVDNAQLMSLGLLPRTSPTPRTLPGTPPILEVTSVSSRLVNVRIHGDEPDRRGLPFGANGVNIYSFVGPAAPTNPREYHYEGTATRATTQILFPDTVASGALIWLSGCWMGAGGRTSIGSTPISFTLQGGAIPAAV